MCVVSRLLPLPLSLSRSVSLSLAAAKADGVQGRWRRSARVGGDEGEGEGGGVKEDRGGSLIPRIMSGSVRAGTIVAPACVDRGEGGVLVVLHLNVYR